MYITKEITIAALLLLYDSDIQGLL